MNIVVGIAALLSLSGFAHGGYIGRVVGLVGGSQHDAISISPGDLFTGAVVLDGPVGTRADFALFRLVFSTPEIEHDTGWFNWSAPFTTGGIDDFSSPGVSAAGSINADTFNDALEPGAIDVAFENLSDQFGEAFETGVILSFTLKVPQAFQPGAFTIDFAPDTFTDGATFVSSGAGLGLTVTVIPAPTTASVMFGSLFTIMRQRRRSCLSTAAEAPPIASIEQENCGSHMQGPALCSEDSHLGPTIGQASPQ